MVFSSAAFFFEKQNKIVKIIILMNFFAAKVTNYLAAKTSLKMAERSEAKSAKRSFASNIKIPRYSTRNFASRFLASLRSAISLILVATDWSLSPRGLRPQTGALCFWQRYSLAQKLALNLTTNSSAAELTTNSCRQNSASASLSPKIRHLQNHPFFLNSEFKIGGFFLFQKKAAKKVGSNLKKPFLSKRVRESLQFESNSQSLFEYLSIKCDKSPFSQTFFFRSSVKLKFFKKIFLLFEKSLFASQKKYLFSKKYFFCFFTLFARWPEVVFFFILFWPPASRSARASRSKDSQWPRRRFDPYSSPALRTLKLTPPSLRSFHLILV